MVVKDLGKVKLLLKGEKFINYNAKVVLIEIMLYYKQHCSKKIEISGFLCVLNV